MQHYLYPDSSYREHRIHMFPSGHGVPYASTSASSSTSIHAGLAAAPGERGSALPLNSAPFLDGSPSGGSSFDQDEAFDHGRISGPLTHTYSYERYLPAPDCNNFGLAYDEGGMHTSGRGYEASAVASSSSITLDHGRNASSFVDATVPRLGIAGPSRTAHSLAHYETNWDMRSQDLGFIPPAVLPHPTRGVANGNTAELAQRDLQGSWDSWSPESLHGGNWDERHTFLMGGARPPEHRNEPGSAGGGAYFLSPTHPNPDPESHSPTSTINKDLLTDALPPEHAFFPHSVSLSNNNTVLSPLRTPADMAIFFNSNSTTRASSGATRGRTRGRSTVARNFMRMATIPDGRSDPNAAQHDPNALQLTNIGTSLPPEYDINHLHAPSPQAPVVYPDSMMMDSSAMLEEAPIGPNTIGAPDHSPPSMNSTVSQPSLTTTPAMLAQQLASNASIQTQTRERRHGCAMCYRRFDRPSTLKKHMLVHTREKAFVCDICGRRFGVSSNLNRHVRKCVLKPVNSLSKNKPALDNDNADPPSPARDTMGGTGAPPLQGGEGVAATTATMAASDTASMVTNQLKRSRPRSQAAPKKLANAPADTSTNATGNEAPKRRKRRAPSKSRWVPDSLMGFNLCPDEAKKAVPVPLPPVQPSPSMGEERNSFDENIDFEKPYHPDGWKDRLPGPGLGLSLGFQSGNMARGGKGGGLGGRDVGNMHLGQVASRGGWLLGRVSHL